MYLFFETGEKESICTFLSVVSANDCIMFNLVVVSGSKVSQQGLMGNLHVQRPI
jgi:hypothetical protein